MFPESLEYMSGVFMVEGYIILGVNSHVIHVDFKPFFWEHVCKDVVHESLEGGRSIAKPKEHDGGFKQSHRGNEGGFPLILLSDVDVVIPSMNVEFGEQGGFFHIVNEFQDEGKWIGISDGVGV